tara:strand:- start:342 stop:509 length:168 start_codon:yes stop_codon:yes gene_type:complete
MSKNMKFNKEQHTLILDILVNQKIIWTSDKKEYKQDLDLLNQVLTILNKENKNAD